MGQSENNLYQSVCYVMMANLLTTKTFNIINVIKRKIHCGKQFVNFDKVNIQLQEDPLIPSPSIYSRKTKALS